MQLLQLKQLSQGSNVRLCHLESFVLAQLPVVAQVGDVLPQAVEGVVEAVHPLPLPSVSGFSSFAPVFQGDEMNESLFIVRSGASLILLT